MAGHVTLKGGRMSLVGSKVGNYDVTRLLGRGGMGEVYVGEHPLIHKQVAIKVLRQELAQQPTLVARFFAEARAVTSIKHHNIVEILDFGQTRDPESGRDTVYILMELLEGESLSTRLERGPLGETACVLVLSQAASALAASHAKAIIHRDLKPDNIFLCRRGDDELFVKLLDFGVAKLSPSGGSAWKTRTGQVVGTPTYMSPEQCAGKKQIDGRSDIYSLGVVLFQALTGSVPFPGDSLSRMLAMHMNEPPPRPSTVRPGVSPRLEAIVLRCLEKAPADRYQTCEELQHALEGKPSQATGADTVVESGGAKTVIESSRAKPKPASPPTMLEVPRNRPIALYAVLGAVAIGGALVAVLRPKSTAPAPPVAAVASPAPVAPVAAPVRLQLESSPAGAEVRQGSSVLGTTPLTLTRKKGEPPFDVQLSMPGYKSEARTLTTDADLRVEVALAKEPPPPPAAHAPAHHAHHRDARPSEPERFGDGIEKPAF
jgi:serine/threonine-protein kinase